MEQLEAVQSAAELVAQDPAVLEAQWAGLSDEALLEEIKKYKEAVKTIASDLSRLGTHEQLTNAPPLEQKFLWQQQQNSTLSQ